MNKKILTLFTLIIYFGLSVNAQTTWYISTTGNDSNNGLSSATPFATINNAIGLSACGDSIYVLGGTYHEKILASTICPENNRLVIQGDITNRPLIIGDSLPTNKYAVGASGEGFRFRYFEFTSPYPNICSQANQVIVGNGDHFDFIDIIVRNSGFDGIKVYGDCGTSNFAVNWKIINSQIINNGLACPESIVNGDGIDFTECRNCLIQGCIIKDNQGHQIQIKLESYNVSLLDNFIEGKNIIQIGLPGSTAQCVPTALNADSIYIRNNIIIAKGDTSEFVFKLADVSNLYIENNTIVKDSISDLNVGFICFGGCAGDVNWLNYPQAPVVIRNNIFYSVADVPFYYGVDTTFFDPTNVLNTEVAASNNLFYDNFGEFLVPPFGVTTSLVANPLFCNYPASYELGDLSPCIDTGDPSTPNDPDGSVNDIGALYYQAPCMVGIQYEDNFNSFFIYPNPSNGMFNIIVDDTFINEKLEIYNSLNQIVLTIHINSNQFEINLREFPNGIYFIKVINTKGNTIISEKLVKN